MEKTKRKTLIASRRDIKPNSLVKSDKQKNNVNLSEHHIKSAKDWELWFKPLFIIFYVDFHTYYFLKI